MDKNILVIGNGFDIYHGLETKYYDFVQYTMQVNSKEKIVDARIYDICEKNMFIKYFQDAANANGGWIDCEKDIEMISHIFSKIINNDHALEVSGAINEKVILENELRVLEYAKEYIKHSESTMTGLEWWGINSKYKHIFNIINKELMIRDLVKDLNEFIETFYYYLKQEINNKPIEVLSNQIKNINFSYVINFNYTNTYRVYNINPGDVYFIHGSVDNGLESIVLGTKDVEEESLDFIYFRKYFQKIQKKLGLLDKNRFESFMDFYNGFIANGNVTVYFFGHSLSSTDGDIIKEVEGLSDKMVIYYYNQKDYEQKVINLIDVFGKKRALELINEGKVDFIKLEEAIKK